MVRDETERLEALTQANRGLQKLEFVLLPGGSPCARVLQVQDGELTNPYILAHPDGHQLDDDILLPFWEEFLENREAIVAEQGNEDLPPIEAFLSWLELRGLGYCQLIAADNLLFLEPPEEAEA